MFYHNASTDLPQWYVINLYLSPNNQGVAMLYTCGRINSKDRKLFVFCYFFKITSQNDFLGRKASFLCQLQEYKRFFQVTAISRGKHHLIARIPIAVFPRNS